MPKWLFRRFIARRVIQNPVRLVLLVWAVALATTLISSVVRVSVAGVESFEESLGYSADAYPLTVTPRGGRISLHSLDRCLSPLGARFEIAAYRREVGEVMSGHVSRAISVIGVTAGGGEGLQSRSEGTILFSHRAMHDLNLVPGSPLELRVGESRFTGEVAVTSQLSEALPAISAVVPLAWFSREGGEPLIDALLVRPLGNQPADVYRQPVGEWLSTCMTTSIPLQVDTARTRIDRGESLVAAYRFNVMIMAAMTLLVCALLVSQATQLSLRNLARELSILRTLGVGRFACLSAVVKESAMIAAIGAFLGVTIGEPVTVRITELFLQTAQDIYSLSLGARSSYHVIERCAVVAGIVALCVVGAIFGGIEAVHVSPAIGTRAAFRQAQPIRAVWAVPFAMCGVALSVAVGLAAYWSTSTILAYTFVATCILSVVCLTPFVILIAPRALTGVGESLFVWFARGGITTNGRNFLLGATGASVSMTLICALSLMVGSFRATLEGWTAQRLQGDLFVSAALEGEGNEARIAPHLPGEISHVKGVRRVIPYYETMTSYQGRPLMMSASDLEAQLDRGIYVLRSGSLDRAVLISGTAALASESAARKLGIRVGDVITVDEQPFKIVAIIQEFGTEHPLIHIDTTRFLARYPGHRPENLTIDLEPSEGVSVVRERVHKVVGALGIVRDNRELRDLVVTLFDRTFRITLSIRWIVFGIALLGLMLAALQHLWERRREIKTMHVLGCSPGEIVGAHVVESTVVCALPVLVGLVGGVGLGWGLTALVNPRSFGWSLTFSLSIVPVIIALGFIVAVAVVVGVAARVFLNRTLREATLSDE